MKKVYNIKNIHCADCARSLEEVINDIKEVQFARINFVTEKFELEISDSEFEVTLVKIKKIIRDFSRNVELFEEVNKNPQYGSKRGQIRLILKGVECANCGAKISEAVGKLKEVVSADFNISTGVLLVELNQESTQLLSNRIKSLIHSIDPRVKIKEKNGEETKKFNPKVVFYILGLLLAVPVVLNSYAILSLSKIGVYLFVVASALCLGYSTYLTAIRMLLRLNINENLLVTISVVGAILIGELIEGLMVIALYTLGKMLEAKAVNKSRKSIQSLLEISPDFAVVIRNGQEEKVSPNAVSVGETIIVRPGEKVALDGEVVMGNCSVNAQSLTGESTPINKKIGDEVLAGVIVLDGVLEIKVLKPLEESTTTKILNLIEKASNNKSKTETFISKFSKYYTLLVVVLAVAVGVLTGLILNDWSTAIYRGLIFLVISCPCAFAISVPLSYFSGVGKASQNGILVKGSNYLDACAKAKMIAFDKTGTLTSGDLVVSEVEVIETAYEADELLRITAIGEQFSIHPIAKSILNVVNDKNLPKAENYKEIPGVGISFEYEGTEYFVGRSYSIEEKTSVSIKKGNILLGNIYFEDAIKTDSLTLSQELKELGVETAILSGDSEVVAKNVAEKLSVQNVYSEMLPEDKYKWIENKKYEMEKGEKLIYVGDGINDAPSLALADVGISMGIHGSGASIESADVVLVDDNPSKTVDLIKISRFTKKLVIQNIVFASTIKIACLILGTLGFAKMFMAVFADVGVTILAVLNSLRMIKFNPQKRGVNDRIKR